MRWSKTAFIALTVMFMAGSALAADTYTIDPAHSSIGFAVRHLGLSKVKGSFTDFSGTITFDAKDIGQSSVSVVIKTASINTGNEGRDKHLRSGDFFDVEKYPEITFISDKVEKKDDGYAAHGTLTMHGVSQKIVLPFTLTGPVQGMQGEFRMAAETGTKLDRQTYGITWSKTLDAGGLVVGNEVGVEIDLEAVKK